MLYVVKLLYAWLLPPVVIVAAQSLNYKKLLHFSAKTFFMEVIC